MYATFALACAVATHAVCTAQCDARHVRGPMVRHVTVGENGKCTVAPDAEMVNWVFGIALPRRPGFVTVAQNIRGDTDPKWTYWPDLLGSGGDVDGFVSPLFDTLNSFTPADPYLIYNDHTESQDGEMVGNGYVNSGHAKGMIHRCQSGKAGGAPRGAGLWLHTSTPSFPPLPGDGDGGRTFVDGSAVRAAGNMRNLGGRNGQHFALVRLPELTEDGVDPIVDVMNLAKANIWDVQGDMFKDLDGYDGEQASAFTLTENITLFAKSPKATGLDFAAYIASALDVSFTCQTWNQKNMFAPTETVKNARLLRTPRRDDIVNGKDMPEDAEQTWGNTYDHSKWCTDGTGWSCALSLNRAVTQTKRGGDAVCFNDVTLAGLLLKLVVVSETTTGFEVAEAEEALPNICWHRTCKSSAPCIQEAKAENKGVFPVSDQSTPDTDVAKNSRTASKAKVKTNKNLKPKGRPSKKKVLCRQLELVKWPTKRPTTGKRKRTR